MSSATEGRQSTMDSTQIYREETFTDRKVGTIRRLTPVGADGSIDSARPVLFVGQAQVMTPMGAMPISFELEAATLDAAIAQFGAAAEQAVHQTMRELQELRREQASSLVIPDAGGASLRIQATCSAAAGRGASPWPETPGHPARIVGLQLPRENRQALERGCGLRRLAPK